MLLGLFLALLSCCFSSLAAQTNLPPAPERLLLDEARAFSPQQAFRLRQELERFERQYQHRIFVYARMQSPKFQKPQDFACNLFDAWQLDSTDLLLLIVREERKVYLCHQPYLAQTLSPRRKQRILDLYFGPALHREDYAQGLARALPAIKADLKSLPIHLKKLPKSRTHPLLISSQILFIYFCIFLIFKILYSLRRSIRHRPWLLAVFFLLGVWPWLQPSAWYWIGLLSLIFHLHRLYVYFPRKARFLPFLHQLLTLLFGLGAGILILLGGELMSQEASFFQLWFVADALLKTGLKGAYLCLMLWLPLYAAGIIRRARPPRSKILWALLGLSAAVLTGLRGFATQEWIWAMHSLGLWLPGLPPFAPLVMLGVVYLFAFWIFEWVLGRI